MKEKPFSENIRLREDGRAVVILDQTMLPLGTVYAQLKTPEEMYDAISTLKVRGAPAIGIFAAYCMYVLAEASEAGEKTDGFLEKLRREGEYLKSSRPTAVNLSWAVDRMMRRAEKETKEGRPISDVTAALREEAFDIHREDIDMCARISEYGLSLLKDGDGILTHCNAGPLATSRYGTGSGGPCASGKRERHGIPMCLRMKTRPLLQGARLTSYELQRAGSGCHSHM